MRALVIGPDEKAAIAALIAKATANPTPISQLELRQKLGMALNDDQTIMLPVGFNVTFTHEDHADTRCRHMSVSIDRANHGPDPAVVTLLMTEFGFVNPFGKKPMWLEALDNGEFAINVLEPLDGNIERLRK